MFQHKDLGVTISTNLHWTEHYSTIITKAYKTLGLLRSTFNVNKLYCTFIVFSQKQLYISFVRSQLLYYCQLWRPELSKDIFTLECVNCRATKYIFKQLQVAIQRET